MNRIQPRSSDASVFLRIMRDIVLNSAVRNIRARRPAYIHGGNEFEATRRDGAYKVLTPVPIHPKNGADLSRSELKDGLCRIHVVQTLTTGTGAAVGRSSEFSGSSGITIAFIAKSLAEECGATRYTDAVRILFPDRARDLDIADAWGAFPRLRAAASDPHSNGLEVESCTGGKKTSLSSPLRALQTKSPRRTTTMVGMRRLTCPSFKAGHFLDDETSLGSFPMCLAPLKAKIGALEVKKKSSYGSL